MLKSFREHIRDEFFSLINTEDPEFRIVKRTTGSAQAKKNIGPLLVAIELQTFSNKDYVIPNLLWSKRNRVPKESNFDPTAFLDCRGKLEELDVEEEVILDAIHFGKPTNAIQLTNTRASEIRLKELYNSDAGVDVIRDYKSLGFDSWETDDILQRWGMLDEYFPGKLSQKDIAYATSGTVVELTQLISTLFFPYLEKLENRFT